MHTFQPYPREVVEINPWVKIGDEWAAICAEKDGKANAMTASWGGVGVMWNKDVATVYIRESRYTKELIDGSDLFSICFFDNTPSNKATLKILGSISGRNEDKMAGCKLHINHHKDVPFIDEASFVLVCKKLSKTEMTPDQFIDPEIKDTYYKDGDYHTMYIGEILEILAR